MCFALGRADCSCKYCEPTKEHEVEECVVVATGGALAFANHRAPNSVISLCIADRAGFTIRQFASCHHAGNSFNTGNRVCRLTSRKAKFR
jgi:hypothetical protein